MAFTTNFDFTKDNSFVRKTDESIVITVKYKDGDLLLAGTYAVYFTVRKNIPKTSVTVDTGADVIIHKVVTNTLSVPSAVVTFTIGLTQIDLDVDPKTYYYDIKLNFPDNFTTSITKGYKLLTITSDITRSNT